MLFIENSSLVSWKEQGDTAIRKSQIESRYAKRFALTIDGFDKSCRPCANQAECGKLHEIVQMCERYCPITNLLATMKLKPAQLEHITRVTLEHYNQRATDFWEGTRDHDVRQNIESLLDHIEGVPPFSILDFGCGPGRDLMTFRALGHRAVGLEGSAQFAAMARTHSECEVWQQDFLQLDLPAAAFDGVFANASLFHVPSQELPRVLAALHSTLKPRGVLFASNPRGDNSEGWQGERYGAYHDLESWRGYMSGAGFAELTHYYRPPGLPREQQPWLASVWRK
jgi:SAM-dependent methyltransferase